MKRIGVRERWKKSSFYYFLLSIKSWTWKGQDFILSPDGPSLLQVPSMRQLHLHVVSQDFDSKHLKNKKHWNSFTTAFFRDSVDVIEDVTRQGKVILEDDEKILSMELRCHRCRSAHPNIPRLKSHITNCQAPFPANLLKDGRLVSASDNANVVP